MIEDAHYWDEEVHELDQLSRSIFLSARKRRQMAGMRDGMLAAKRSIARAQAYFWGRHRNAMHRSRGLVLYDAVCDVFYDIEDNGRRRMLPLH